MFVGIHHTALSTRDLDRLVRFYQELFDFELEFDFPWDERHPAFRRTHAVAASPGTVVMIGRGDHRLEPTPVWLRRMRRQRLAAGERLPRDFLAQIEREAADHPERAHADLGISHFCFQVTDLAKEYERLSAAGMAFQSPPVEQTPEVVNCYGRDPDGNLIELIEFRA